MRTFTELETASTGELVELAFAALGVLAARPAPGCPSAAMELAERLAAGLDLGEAALAGMVTVADTAGEPSARHYAGTRGWLKVALGMRTGRADERLTLARQLPRLPKVAAMLAAEKLSFGHAATIADAVAHLSDADCAKAEELLLGMVAEGFSPTKVARFGARIKDVIAERDGTEDPGEDGRRGDRSWWRLAKSLNGAGAVKGWFDPELLALVNDRLGPLAKPAGPEDDRDHAQRMADALRMMLSGGGSSWNATLVIKLGEEDHQRPGTAEDPRLAGLATGKSSATSSVAANPGAGNPGDGGTARHPRWPLEGARVSARLADGTPIRPEQARIIALNAGVSALVLGSHGIPIYLGRRVRLVTAAQRVALEALCETCACDECDIPVRFCQLDHVFNWVDGGTTDIDRLAPACAFHNRLKYAHPDWVIVTRGTTGRWRYSIRRPRTSRTGRDRARGP